jgi:hypothetical protein
MNVERKYSERWRRLHQEEEHTYFPDLKLYSVDIRRRGMTAMWRSDANWTDMDVSKLFVSNLLLWRVHNSDVSAALFGRE